MKQVRRLLEASGRLLLLGEIGQEKRSAEAAADATFLLTQLSPATAKGRANSESQRASRFVRTRPENDPQPGGAGAAAAHAPQAQRGAAARALKRPSAAPTCSSDGAPLLTEAMNLTLQAASSRHPAARPGAMAVLHLVNQAPAQFALTDKLFAVPVGEQHPRGSGA